MKKEIINIEQLEHLVDIGVLYKTRDDTYHILINHKVWGYVCMPPNMVRDVAGKAVDVKVDKCDGEADRWVTDDANALYIQPWMLTDFYDNIKTWGKYIPEPSGEGDNPGFDTYTLRIISREQLEELVKSGIVTKETIGNGYTYKPVITDMGQVTMPALMAEQLCGKVLACDGTGTTWVESLTEHRWSISQWMLSRNFQYLLSRQKGCLDPEQLEYEGEEEDDEEEEEEPETRNHVNIIGEITEKTDNTILVSTEYTDVLVHYVTGDKYGVGHRVSVEGYLVRTSNMMGYPEIKCNYIQEV